MIGVTSLKRPLTVKLPALIPVAPVYVFTPESVNVPVPVLASCPVPEITPLKVVEAFVPPTPRVWDANSIDPEPAMDATASFVPKLSVDPEPTVTAVLSLRLPVIFRVPAFTFVAPV